MDCEQVHSNKTWQTTPPHGSAITLRDCQDWLLKVGAGFFCAAADFGVSPKQSPSPKKPALVGRIKFEMIHLVLKKREKARKAMVTQSW